MRIENGLAAFEADATGRLALVSPGWPGFRLGGLAPDLVTEAGELGAEARTEWERGDGWRADTRFAGGLELRQTLTPLPGGGFRLESALKNAGRASAVLERVRALATAHRDGEAPRLGAEPGRVALYEQGSYWARVRPLASSGQAAAAAPVAGEPGGAAEASPAASEAVWVAWDAAARRALLVGWETGERWIGHVGVSATPAGVLSQWWAGFDGGATRIPAGARVPLEALLVLVGEDPLALLARYGDLTAARHGVLALAEPPVTWCSWYPHRLGVTTERVLRNADVAAARLRALGLRTLLVDLGWQEGWLPSEAREKSEFPGGLGALAAELERRGFRLGAWTAPFTVSALDPVVREHPEWFARDERGQPIGMGEWFWEPHGQTHALDLSHPGAVEWVRERVRSLARRGVRYLKPDFMGSAVHPVLKRRHDPEVVTGAGAEAIRRGMLAMLEEMRAADPNALVLNCGAPDLPGTGAPPLLYTCADTGNTGYVGWRHLEEDYGRNVAGHLWKNGRWGTIQPSCLVTGQPGTLEEARVRATATFLAGGQVDIGDDLPLLPEDRWRVLLATLPPLGRSATPLDLFEPFPVASLDYESQTRGKDADARGDARPGVSRVWALQVETGWDRWQLVALFHYGEDIRPEYGKASIARFRLPLARLGLDPATQWWAHEFWSGQFLGASPFVPERPRGYRHPGDTHGLLESLGTEAWEASFFGPAVKLLVVRQARAHPWVVATTFHQSGGAELRDVAWKQGALRGVLRRPAGEDGALVIAGAERLPEARVAGAKAVCRRGANGSVVVPIVAAADETEWELTWG